MIKLQPIRENQTFAVVPRRYATDVELVLTNRMTKDVRAITATATESNGLLLITAKFDATEGQEFDMLITDSTGTIHRSFVLFTDQESFSPIQKYVTDEETSDNTFIVYE